MVGYVEESANYYNVGGAYTPVDIMKIENNLDCGSFFHLDIY